MPRDLIHDPAISALRRDIQELIRAAAVEQLHLADPDTIAAIIAREATALLAIAYPCATPRELAKAFQAKRKKIMLADYERLLSEGKGRSAATIVARNHALDPHDPVEVETIAHWLRRQRLGSQQSV